MAAIVLPAIVLPTVDWLGATLLLVQCLCIVTIIAILEHTGPAAGDDKLHSQYRVS